MGELDGRVAVVAGASTGGGRAVARHGRPDVVVDAATVSGTAALDLSQERWAAVMGVNMTGLFHGCKRAVAEMIAPGPAPTLRPARRWHRSPRRGRSTPSPTWRSARP